MSACAAGNAVELRTARLRLRPMADADLPAFVAYRRDPEVARYQGWDETFSAEDARALFEKLGGVAPDARRVVPLRH
jgi:aminoglycoside 6'-N-acetyltransferase